MRRFNRHSIYDSDPQLYTRKYCKQAARDLYSCGSLGMFLVSLLYERNYLRIDLVKINCCLNVPFMIWFLYVLNSITSEFQCNSQGVFIALAERMTYFILARIYLAFYAKCLPHSILCVLLTGQGQFVGISKFIQSKESNQQGLFTNYCCLRIGD